MTHLRVMKEATQLADDLLDRTPRIASRGDVVGERFIELRDRDRVERAAGRRAKLVQKFSDP